MSKDCILPDKGNEDNAKNVSTTGGYSNNVEDQDDTPDHKTSAIVSEIGPGCKSVATILDDLDNMSNEKDDTKDQTDGNSTGNH